MTEEIKQKLKAQKNAGVVYYLNIMIKKYK